MQGLLHHNSSFPLPKSDSYYRYGFLPEDQVVVLPCKSATADFSLIPILIVLLQSFCWFLFGLPNVDLATAVGGVIYHCLPRGNVTLSGESAGTKDYSDVDLPANMPDILTHPGHIGYHHQWSLLPLLCLVVHG